MLQFAQKKDKGDRENLKGDPEDNYPNKIDLILQRIEEIKHFRFFHPLFDWEQTLLDLEYFFENEDRFKNEYPEKYRDFIEHLEYIGIQTQLFPSFRNNLNDFKKVLNTKSIKKSIDEAKEWLDTHKTITTTKNGREFNVIDLRGEELNEDDKTERK